MSYINYNVKERGKFKRKYIEFSTNKYIKVEYKNENNSKCIIWLPGRNDYFYHYHFTEKFNNYDVYSIMFKNNHARRTDVIHHVDNVIEHVVEIDCLYDYFNINNYEEVILYGHSTGGLIAILYYEQNLKNKISKMILNSPFIKFKRHWIENFFLNYIAWYLFDYIPDVDISFSTNKSNCYTLKLSENYKINKKYKCYYDVPVISSWIINIIKHHKRISCNKIKINIPTLILFCSKSIKNNFKENGDSVLNMEANIKQVPNLFDNEDFLDLKIINEGTHDLLCADGDLENEETPLGKVIFSIESFLKN